MSSDMAVMVLKPFQVQPWLVTFHIFGRQYSLWEYWITKIFKTSTAGCRLWLSFSALLQASVLYVDYVNSNAVYTNITFYYFQIISPQN